MSRSIGLAYAVTGAALASAVIAITASTAGLFDGGQATAASASLGAAERAFAMEPGNGLSATGVGGPGEPTQYVYVDEPTARRSHEEHERSEHGGRGERAEHEHDDD